MWLNEMDSKQAYWVYSARYEDMSISAKVKMMLVVMARVSAERKKQVTVDSSRYRGQGQHLTAVASRFRKQVMSLWKKDDRPNYVQDQVTMKFFQTAAP